MSNFFTIGEVKNTCSCALIPRTTHGESVNKPLIFHFACVSLDNAGLGLFFFFKICYFSWDQVLWFAS